MGKLSDTSLKDVFSGIKGTLYTPVRIVKHEISPESSEPVNAF